MALLAFSAGLVSAEDANQLEGKVLMPTDEKDYSNLLAGMMEHQVSLLEKVHGADSPYVSLASNLMSLQSTVGGNGLRSNIPLFVSYRLLSLSRYLNTWNSARKWSFRSC